MPTNPVTAIGSDGTNWTLIGSMTRNYGATLRVGVSTWNASTTAFNAEFDNFMIVVPEPSTAWLSLIGLSVLGSYYQRWRKRAA